MSAKKDDGIKSAYELAMERLAGAGGEEPALSKDLLRDLAAADDEARAKIAELEIMAQQRIAEARAQGDEDAVRELEQARAREARAVREAAEAEKQRIRERG